MNVLKRKMLPLSKQLQLQLQTGTNPVDSQHFNHLCKEKSDKSRFFFSSPIYFLLFPPVNVSLITLSNFRSSCGHQVLPSQFLGQKMGTVPPGCFAQVSRCNNCLKKFVLSSFSMESCNLNYRSLPQSFRLEKTSSQISNLLDAL